MPRVSHGTIYRPNGTRNWFLKFYVDGKLQRQTTRTPDREQALVFLKERVKQASRGVFTDLGGRITFGEMLDLLISNYRSKGNRTDPLLRVRRLAEFFGSMLGEEITEPRIAEYSRKRLDRDGVEAATLRRELAILERMLRLASARLPRVPFIEMPRVNNARQGYFEEKDLESLLPHLPSHTVSLVEFLYLTGWRTGEAFRLQWRDVDWRQQIVLLRESKNRDARVFPFKYHLRLEGVLMRQRSEVSAWERKHEQLCPSVFHWRGRPVKTIRRSWQNACIAAGLEGRLLHDFRRSAVRNLIRAGVQQAIAMRITGHRTDTSFRRYLIVDEEMLAHATGAVAAYLEEKSKAGPQ